MYLHQEKVSPLRAYSMVTVYRHALVRPQTRPVLSYNHQETPSLPAGPVCPAGDPVSEPL